MIVSRIYVLVLIKFPSNYEYFVLKFSSRGIIICANTRYEYGVQSKLRRIGHAPITIINK